MKNNFDETKDDIVYIPKFLELYKYNNKLKKIPYSDQEYQKVYKYLPDLVLKKVGLVPEDFTINDCQKSGLLLLREYREIFTVISRWIFDILYPSNPNNQCNLNTNIQIKIPLSSVVDWELEYIYMAQRSWNLWQLCQHILERDPLHWKDTYEGLTPTIMWFNSELETLENTFESNGLLAQFNFVGKEETYKQNQKNLKILKSLVKNQNPRYQSLREKQIKNKPLTESIYQSILAYAILIAQEDDYFHWYILDPFFKSISWIGRYYRDNCNFQIKGLTDNDEIRVGGDGKRGVAKKNKGIAKSRDKNSN